MTKTLKYYIDPGHGWFAVKRDMLHKLGIADKITSYSYQKGKTVYLEEDCDASLFFETAKAAGWNIDYKTIHHDKIGMPPSPIRNYEHYQPQYQRDQV